MSSAPPRAGGSPGVAGARQPGVASRHQVEGVTEEHRNEERGGETGTVGGARGGPRTARGWGRGLRVRLPAERPVRRRPRVAGH